MTLIDFSTRTANSARFCSARTVGRQKQALMFVIFITFTLLLALGSRLFYLQIGEGERNRQLADENRIRLIPKQAERGEILDRKGRILAGSRLSYSVFLYPISVEKSNWTNVRKQLAQLLNLSEAEIQKRLDQAGNNSATLVRLARGLNPAQITALKEHKSELPGIEVDIEPIRYYPNGDLAAHVLGYTGEITDEAFPTLKDQGYSLGDIVGQAGIEAVFEEQLRGERGGQQVEVDGSGQIDRILGEKPVQAGQDVRLTLDLD
ncbi:penicillin-binding protein 2, partial [Microcoleus sp. FACHB-1515]|nr:penicillin-binding protein 2 [Microcoleus sp. FACHB-1515]